MTNKSKIAMIVAVAALGIVSPAFAQSSGPDIGTGNIAPVVEQAPARQVAAHQSGLHAFAMVPRDQADVNSNAAALKGGGSTGYNELLEQH
jgi:hypothetical protein